MNIEKAKNIIKTRKYPRENDWELLDAAKFLLEWHETKIVNTGNKVVVVNKGKVIGEQG